MVDLRPGAETRLFLRAFTAMSRRLRHFFEGKKETLLKNYRRRMERAAKAQLFEEAALWRNKVFALEHIQDVSMLAKEDENDRAALMVERASSHVGSDDQRSTINDSAIFGRIEGYDISHVSGTSTVASMGM
jgi:excinuclease ABC subunit C